MLMVFRCCCCGGTIIVMVLLDDDGRDGMLEMQQRTVEKK